MQCDTCQQDTPIVMRVVVDKDYNRMLARPVYNCPSCFAKKEDAKRSRRTVPDSSLRKERVGNRRHRP